MTPEGITRHLIAILSADVKDYTRLISQDDVGTRIKRGTSVQNVHYCPKYRDCASSGIFPRTSPRVMQEVVTPRYRATSAPE
jgi:hypothetical protein